MKNSSRFQAILLVFTSAIFLVGPLQRTWAASGEEIVIGVQATLERFITEIIGGEAFLDNAYGALVFPKVVKAGIGIGGEYGEGALVADGEVVDYYNTVSASFGFQLGAQVKSFVLVFLTQEALDQFQKNEGWKVGVDGSVALVKWGVGEDINNVDHKTPIAGFIFNNKGLMYNLTIEGAKMTRIKK